MSGIKRVCERMRVGVFVELAEWWMRISERKSEDECMSVRSCVSVFVFVRAYSIAVCADVLHLMQA